MKKFYLLCNAHPDPVWLWKREEGMAEVISIFRVAAKFSFTPFELKSLKISGEKFLEH